MRDFLIGLTFRALYKLEFRECAPGVCNIYVLPRWRWVPDLGLIEHQFSRDRD